MVVRHHRRWYEQAVVAGEPRPKRQLRVLVVQEEPLVEAIQGVEQRPWQREARPAHGAHPLLRLKDLGRLTEASADGDPADVHLIAARVHPPGIGCQHQLRGAQHRPFVRGERSHHRVEPARLWHRVGVQEHCVAAGRPRHRQVVRRPVAKVLGDALKPHPWVAGDLLGGAVGGCVVDDEHFVGGAEGSS